VIISIKAAVLRADCNVRLNNKEIQFGISDRSSCLASISRPCAPARSRRIERAVLDLYSLLWQAFGESPRTVYGARVVRNGKFLVPMNPMCFHKPSLRIALGAISVLRGGCEMPHHRINRTSVHVHENSTTVCPAFLSMARVASECFQFA